MKILFTYKVSKPTFVQSEIDLLNEIGQVTEFRFDQVPPPVNVLGYLRQLVFLLTHQFDIYYCYFGDVHGLLPVLYAKLTGRKSVIIVAGYDAMKVEFKGCKYGIFWNRYRGTVVRVVYKYATHILTLSDALQRHLRTNGINRDFQTVYPGISGDFKPGVKSNLCVMVGYGKDPTGFYRKGYDRFIKLAELLPEFTFIALGLDYHVDLINFYQTPNATHRDVELAMSQAKVYIHPARAEGFGISITEAMASGCAIITSDADGIPENYPNYCLSQKEWDSEIEMIAGAIRVAMKESYPIHGSVEYSQKFNLEARKKQLETVLKSEKITNLDGQIWLVTFVARLALTAVLTIAAIVGIVYLVTKLIH